MAVAIAQEDADLEGHAKFLSHFEPFGGPAFDIVCDVKRAATPRYDRTTTYLLDGDGRVVQVFPQLTHFRAAWAAVRHELTDGA